MTSTARSDRRREWLVWVALGLAGLLVASAYLPPLFYPLWMLRYFARELALFAVLLALIALGLLLRPLASAAPGRPLRLRLAAALLLGLGSLPVATTLPLFARQGQWFSPWQYFRFSAPIARAGQVVEEHDVALASDRPQLLVDVYRPATAPAAAEAGRAAIVVIHGGSFQRGDKGDVPELSRVLAAAGYAVFDLRYRLAPQHPFPAALQDILCIVGRLAEAKARERYTLDGRRIALLGRSAGGTLALSAAYAAALQAAPAAAGVPVPALRAGCAVVDVVPTAVIAIYPWTDLAQVYAAPPQPDPLDSRQVMEAYLGGPAGQLPGPYRHGSPLSYAAARVALPPTLLVHGQADTLVLASESARLAQALAAAGHAVTHLAIPFAEHGFDHRAGGAAEQLARAASLRFLSAALAATRTGAGN